MYIANERMKVGSDTYREVGDVVPEADTWPWHIREGYLRNHRMRLLLDPEPEPSVRAVAKTGRKGQVDG